ncbi:MAG: HAD family hydrolase [Nitrospinaceae bacterium]|nr:HAD family hydrolase [Nitrospinaceae bacterium]NIU47175.1 HAD family hydrolase [Nitrospinaceae bacterium]NIU99384.1 HAD hydrolase family protein [Nitrospinaceae bacterium]NIW61924.1 HAD hydrolase family protein [Nitrospinaceae bacterium]
MDPRKKLFVSDLDGTLLDEHGDFPRPWVQRLNRMIENGLRFTIATARNYDSVHPILHEVHLRLPVILFNGAYLTHFDTGHNLAQSNYIPREVVHEVLDWVVPMGLDPFVYTFDEKHRLYYRNSTNEGSSHYLKTLEGDGRLQYVEQYQFMDGESIAGLLLIDTPKVLEPVYRRLLDQYSDHLNLYFAKDIARPDYFWLQMFHHHADKGKMLRKLLQHLDHPLEQTVVFGDYLNDLEMFEIAGESIAVGNALPEVQAVAHRVIGANHQGAVLDHLESLGF